MLLTWVFHQDRFGVFSNKLNSNSQRFTFHCSLPCINMLSEPSVKLNVSEVNHSDF